MSQVLYIKANPRSQGNSRTYEISDRFIDIYQQTNPGDEIITLDLYQEGIGFLTEDDLYLHRLSPEEGRNHPILKYTYQFLEADKYVFAEPLWNLGVPAILKAYFDYICISGITFKYTDKGPVGLCQGKKAVNITTRGGDYSEAPLASMEMGDRYIKTLLGFLGVTDYTTIAANNLDVIGVDLDAIMVKALKEAEKLAKSF
ncbi:MAG: FMN-dependent NADH-azoreductase [Clostridia bacterium]|jgi:FMN-dependent NADH-azoreductase|nr:FMN-dependent NADH-azoreductase [Clostridia bacterium]